MEAELDAFVGSSIPMDVFLGGDSRPPFDMDRYRRHILELASGCIVHFEGISRIIEDERLDRIFRFVTVIFLQHEGRIELNQEDGGEILITAR